MPPRRGSSQGDLTRWQQQQLREAQRAQKAAEVAAKAAQREQRARLIADGKQSADDQTFALQKEVELLGRLLIAGLARPASIDLGRMIRPFTATPFNPGPLGQALPAPIWEDFEPPAPGLLATLVGGRGRYEAKATAARHQLEVAEQAWSARERERLIALTAAREDHDRRVAERRKADEKYNERLRSDIDGIAARDREPVERYLRLVLRRMPLPEKFPRRSEVAYNPQSEQAVVQLQLPGTEVIPTVKAVRYVQNRNTAEDIARPQRETHELYRDVIAQVALLALRDLFDADQSLTSIAFNGHVDTINRATGKQEYPCIVSLNVERTKFSELVLDRVSPADCLRHLNALVSPHPYELKPIKPILDFDLSKFSFVQGLDAVATLDHRPDLIQMGYGEFEHLVRQVFEAMGMQGWTTTSSNDDGVDAVVVNPTPFVGGLTIIQAKHYKNVVGVNHIRELAGAMEEKKAGRGILVTTSWFTSGGWQKAYEHGRMELIDGARLIHLIKEHLGKDVVIGIKRPKNITTGPTNP